MGIRNYSQNKLIEPKKMIIKNESLLINHQKFFLKGLFNSTSFKSKNNIGIFKRRNLQIIKQIKGLILTCFGTDSGIFVDYGYKKQIYNLLMKEYLKKQKLFKLKIFFNLFTQNMGKNSLQFFVSIFKDWEQKTKFEMREFLVKGLTKKEKVYDIEVDLDHNYIINQENLIIAHNCIHEETRVKMSNQKEIFKKAKDIQIGDYVAGIDNNGVVSRGRVKRIFHRTGNARKITFSNGDKLIFSNHPIWMFDKRWENSDNLKIGDKIALITNFNKMETNYSFKEKIISLTNSNEKQNSEHFYDQKRISKKENLPQDDLFYFLIPFICGLFFICGKIVKKGSEKIIKIKIKIKIRHEKQRKESQKLFANILKLLQIKYTKKVEKNKIEFKIISETLSFIIQEFILHNDKKKMNEFFFVSSEEQMKFILGIFSGCNYTKNKSNLLNFSFGKDEEMRNSVCDILLLIGINFSKRKQQNLYSIELSKLSKYKIETIKDQLKKVILKIKNEKHQNAFSTNSIQEILKMKEKKNFVNVIKIREMEKQPLINYQVDVIETFICERIATHNCGRAGRVGIDTEGESILIAPKKQEEIDNIFQVLVNSPLPPLESTFTLNESKGLRRILIECVSSGLIRTKYDAERLMQSTLCNFFEEKKQKGKMEELLVNSLNYLKENGFIQNNEDEDIYQISDLGQGVVDSCLDLNDSLVLYQELLKAKEGLILDSELHALYYIVPISHNIPVNWQIYEEVYCRMNRGLKKVADLLGVSEGYIFRVTSRIIDPQNDTVDEIARIHRKFFVALLLFDLIQETPLPIVSEKYGVDRGEIQSLMNSAGSFSFQVATFCEKIGFHLLHPIMISISERVNFGVKGEIVNLTQIPYVKPYRARKLYQAGYVSIEDVAKAKVEDIEKLIKINKPMVPSGKFELDNNQEYDQEQEDIQKRIQRKIAFKIVYGARALLKQKQATLISGLDISQDENERNLKQKSMSLLQSQLFSQRFENEKDESKEPLSIHTDSTSYSYSYSSSHKSDNFENDLYNSKNENFSIYPQTESKNSFGFNGNGVFGDFGGEYVDILDNLRNEFNFDDYDKF
ncbi:helicase and polymerase-containing protein [Anaeramoeba ignava]|uniref:Helicase and polymerase-containing protein n=1 Tax=Anaeramoeba ignava TaxID=1746090 RepID=A0A9Q0L5U9_ANAIG|nr:helicase and polymerase-containing protein [Anaeramoeba ignava]